MNDQPGKFVSEKYDSPRAVEERVVELIREWAPKAEAEFRAKRKREPNITIGEVKIVGSFPGTNIGLFCSDVVTGREDWSYYPIWQMPTFVRLDGTYYGPDRIAGDVMMLAEGG